MKSGYMILDHPADLGIEASGRSLQEAFQLAAQALVVIILDTVDPSPSEERKIVITASDQNQLLVRWLSEILYLYDGQQFVPHEFSIHRLTATDLEATVKGEPFSEVKHHTKLDVKAVTYHQLLINEDVNGSIVRVYLDI